MQERIAKYIARAGICSRRKAEELILEGRVKIDNIVIDSPAIKVGVDNEIRVDNKIIRHASTRLWLYHKPRGLITSHKDEKDRPTVFENLPSNMPRVISVGRLDFNTEGLLLLTNDGELSRFMELPSNSWVRKYRVRVYGKLNMARLEKLKQAITIEGVRYKPIDVELEQQKGDNSWLSVSITEGKNREIRKVFDYFNLTVNRLIRVGYGPFHLEDLPVGKVFELSEKDIELIGYNKK